MDDESLREKFTLEEVINKIQNDITKIYNDIHQDGSWKIYNKDGLYSKDVNLVDALYTFYEDYYID